MNDVKCGTCPHWNAAPVPPGPVIVGTPRTGECRGGPPQVLLAGHNLIVTYPSVPEGFPACGVHPGMGEHISAITDSELRNQAHLTASGLRPGIPIGAATSRIYDLCKKAAASPAVSEH